MRQREIRCPKFCAVIFLLSGLGNFLSIATELIDMFVTQQNSFELLHMADCVLAGTATLFISIILFKKHYDKLLIGAASCLVATGIFSAIVSDYVYGTAISVIVDVLLLFIVVVFVCGAEKWKNLAAKIRMVVPVMNIIALIVQGVFTVKGLTDKLGADGSVVMASAVLVVIMLIPVGVLSIINYYKLVKWVVDPYEVTKGSKKKNGGSR
ncbi:MAG: hypothetical protein IJ025_04785 [Clostridia bacterium]|nr:hypothetical protein [Clostridia bacterium]